METYRVINYEPGFAGDTVYDVNISLPICSTDKYQRRLEHFKQSGLFNLGKYRVHLTLIGGEGDWEARESIKSGWPDACSVSLLSVNDHRPLPKVNAYYAWQEHSGLNARWHLRVDDDSITDVAGLLDYVDRTYKDMAVHVMTSPFFNDPNIQVFVDYLKAQRIHVPSIAHEHESSITSNAAMQRVFANQTAMEFLTFTSSHPYRESDQSLSLTMLIAKVPIASNPFATAGFALDQLALTGGSLFHIHYVNWEDPTFAELAHAFLHGAREKLTVTVIDEALGRPLVFGRCLGRVLSELTLISNGIVLGAIAGNESNWTRKEDALMLTRPEGLITTVFDTMLSHGPHAWLIGPHLFEPFIHFLRVR